MYKFGTIVLVPFPFTDLTSTKLRPALIVSKTDPNEENIILCFITSRTPQKIKKCHFTLQATDKYFKTSGLKVNSVICFDKIATLWKKLILGEIGHLETAVMKKMEKTFFTSFGFKN